MIVRPQENWVSLLFVWNGSVLQKIIPQLLFMCAVDVTALLTQGRIFGEKVPLNTTPFTLCGVALTIFLAFRNNASYERYWEARKIWGGIVISTRTLVSQVLQYVPEDADDFDKIAFSRRVIGFVYSLKHQLRNTNPYADLMKFLSTNCMTRIHGKNFIPIALLNLLRAELSTLKREQKITDAQLWLADEQIGKLSDMVGGCERIASTPIPFAYGVLLHRTVYAYCLLLPFGLVDSIGVATPLVSLFVTYTLLALEAIASEIADPFGTEPHNLALDAISRNVERSILELCGQELPDEVKVNHLYQLT